MDNFKAVYKILSTLEASMDLSEANANLFDAETLGVTKERWTKYLEMMEDVGYIKGVRITHDITGNSRVDCTDIRITLKGLEYLQENSIMQRLYKTAKGIKEFVPGL